jgi:hypothetical protein
MHLASPGDNARTHGDATIPPSMAFQVSFLPGLKEKVNLYLQFIAIFADCNK